MSALDILMAMGSFVWTERLISTTILAYFIQKSGLPMLANLKATVQGECGSHLIIDSMVSRFGTLSSTHLGQQRFRLIQQ